MIFLKDELAVENLKKAGTILADCLSLLSLQVQPGITGLQLNKLAEEYVKDHGATLPCKGYNGFPESICLSVNSGAVHCIPTKDFLKEGDVVKLDIVVNYNGWNADSAITCIVSPARKEDEKLVQVTQEALYLGLQQAIEGKKVSDITNAIFAYGKASNVGIIKEFCGHGIGKSIHENPSISNVPRSDGKDFLLVAGMELAIEPIFCAGKADIYYNPKEWPTFMMDGNRVAHFEHSLLVNPFPNPPLILTKRNNEII